MAGPIARRPSGLLDLLLTQQQGKNPTQLGDTTIPTLDLSPFYLQDRLENKRVAVVANATTDSVGIEVPASETWWVYGYGISGIFATVNQSIKARVRLTNITGDSGAELPAMAVSAVGATDIFSDGVFLPQPIMLSSGAELLMQTMSLNLDGQANITVTFSGLFARMTI